MTFEEMHLDNMIEDFRRKIETEKFIPSITRYTFDILTLIKDLQQRVMALEGCNKDKHKEAEG